MEQLIFLILFIVALAVTICISIWFISINQKEWECKHEWGTHTNRERGDSFDRNIILICKKCGKIKKIKL